MRRGIMNLVSFVTLCTGERAKYTESATKTFLFILLHNLMVVGNLVICVNVLRVREI
jgi:hypothetical protein